MIAINPAPEGENNIHTAHGYILLNIDNASGFSKTDIHHIV